MAKVLHIIPYKNLYPPQNGGALRCFHLLSSLAKYNDVDIIVFQAREDLLSKRGYSFPVNVRIYNPTDFRRSSSLLDLLPKKIADAILFRYLNASVKGPAESTLLNIYPALKTLLKSNKYDAVVFEHLQSMMAAKYVKKIRPTTKLLLDAHNVDHILLEKEFKSMNKNGDLLKIISRTKEIESSLNRYVDGFLACSKEDVKVLRNLNPETISFLTPNGVDVENKPYQEKKISSRDIIFCGDLGTIANKDGLLWFYKSILPLIIQQIPEVKLVVVGKGSEAVDFDKVRTDDRVTFAGRVEDVVPYYYKAWVAVAPLRVGSGTRLKILEAMCLGNPVVSTSIGAEGVEYPENSIGIADKEEAFAENVVKLIQNFNLADKQRRHARIFVEKEYSWTNIGIKLNHFIQNLIKDER